jgi:hypothetical protein
MSFARGRVLALGLLAAGVALWVLCRRGSQDVALDDPSLIDGRVWIEKRPEKLTDYVHAAFFLSRANLGVFQRGSSYDVRFEIADVSRKEARLRVYFPQTGRDATTTYRVRSCRDLPPFDLCLDISENPWTGPRRYFGFSQPDEERASLGDLGREVRARAGEGKGATVR